MLTASERSYLTGVPDACNSEVSATAMERLPSAAASSTGGGRKCSGHKSDGHKSGSHKSGSHKSGSHKSGSSHHSSSSSDSEDGDDELHLDEASKASLHIMGTAIPAAVVDGGEGLGGAAGVEGSTGVREEEGDEEEVLAEDGAVVVDACADGHDGESRDGAAHAHGGVED
ncbi:hypothetical protein MNEG_7807 [Monoraphidium neglectum]|uniref:Uncharacterized protein n=1 Tax=Monoraphidium neglectum TaxID=145388 RepID=A0A0D2KY66_9CHLO|nr:hypothetical protein MNEG_7807 [Monoraphidium neglectum]KIZ00154.1 hypothetical protein MNEG_7807 [Monoraphidium neglectum]|eukprot:XP_013899173.1 hypothetical protein MNEG_7807 [Monoraphidium neglectum]